LDYRFNVLVGDSSGDGSVNGGDLSSFGAAFNASVGNARYNPRTDWNSDASVNGGDVPLFSANFNQSLPAGEPGSMPLPSQLFEPLAPMVDWVFGSEEEDEEEKWLPINDQQFSIS
jgi:hypothetical protein